MFYTYSYDSVHYCSQICSKADFKKHKSIHVDGSMYSGSGSSSSSGSGSGSSSSSGSGSGSGSSYKGAGYYTDLHGYNEMLHSTISGIEYHDYHHIC